MSARDRRLAQTKYAGEESASEKAARKAQEKAEKAARKAQEKAEKDARKASRRQTTPAVPPPSKSDKRRTGDEFDAAAWYDEYRKTPQSRKNRAAHRRNIPSDAESGGGEAFADRSARSTTRWFSGMFG